MNVSTALYVLLVALAVMPVLEVESCFFLDALKSLLGFTSIDRKPRLVVFDLDFTLWPFTLDSNRFVPPYKKDAPSGDVYDAKGKLMRPYPEVDSVLRDLKRSGIDIGIASHDKYSKLSNELIDLFGWAELIEYREIYPIKRKTHHFMALKKKTGLRFEDMLFFDDTITNIRVVTPLGVTSILVDKSGVTMQAFDDGLRMYSLAHR